MSPGEPARRRNVRTGLYWPNTVPMGAIRRYARAIAKHFKPNMIVLFGSYACGTPTPHSDVDLLVVMPTKNQVEQSVRIEEILEDGGITPGFFMDLIVRTPKTLETRIRGGDSFLQEIVERGKVLYEKADDGMGRQGGRRLRAGAKARRRKVAVL